jgi:hypothetical protein
LELLAGLTLSILEFSLDSELILIKPAPTQGVRKLRRSVQRNDRKDPSEKLPSGPDQQRANDQERAVPGNGGGFPPALPFGSGLLLRQL